MIAPAAKKCRFTHRSRSWASVHAIQRFERRTNASGDVPDVLQRRFVIAGAAPSSCSVCGALYQDIQSSAGVGARFSNENWRKKRQSQLRRDECWNGVLSCMKLAVR